jgi:hypothetical protein
VGIKVTKISVIGAGLFAVALSVPGIHRPVRAIVRDGVTSVWVDALNVEVAIERTETGFVFEAGEGEV